MSTSAATFSATGVSVRCPLTLGGTFDEGIPKVEAIAMGEVNSASVGSCTGGEVRFLTETMPWWSEYRSFQGTLPNITGVVLSIDNAGVLGTATIFGVSTRCLYRGAIRAILSGTEARQLRIEEATTIPLRTTLSGICPETATMSGTLAVSPVKRMTLSERQIGGVTFTPPSFTNPLMHGTEETRNLAINNSNDSYPYEVHSVDLIGAGAGAFRVTSVHFRVQRLSTSNFPVRFAPAAAGTFNATVRFLNENGGVIDTINITGTAN